MEIDEQGNTQEPALGNNRPLRPRNPDGSWNVAPGPGPDVPAPPEPAPPTSTPEESRSLTSPPAPGPALDLPDKWGAPPKELDLPDKRSALENVHDTVASTDPDVAARVLAASKDLQMPPAQVAADLPNAEKAAKAPSGNYLQELEQRAPGISKWLADPAKMAVAQDDLPNLSMLGSIVQTAKDAFDFHKRALESGGLQEQLAFLRSRELHGEADAEVFGPQSPLAAAASKAQATLGGGVAASTLPEFRLGNLVTSQTLGPNATPEQISAKIEELEKQKPQNYGFKRGLYGAIEFVPQMVGATGFGAEFGAMAAGATAATGVGAPGALAAGGFGFTAGRAIYDYRFMSGLAYDALLKLKDQNGKPLPDDIIKPYAIATGAASAGLSFVQLGAILNRFPVGKALMDKFVGSVGEKVLGNPQTAITAFKAYMNNAAHTALEGGMAMGTLHAINTVGQEWAKSDADFLFGQQFQSPGTVDILKDIGRSAAEGAMSFGVMGLGLGATGLGRDLLQSRKAEQTKELYTTLGENVEKSKTWERLKEVHGGLVSDLTKDSAIENVHIPVEAFDTYFQSKNIDPGTVANELEVPDSYAEAKATGGTVQVPLSTFTEKLVGTEHYQGLADDVKFSPDDLTAREATALKEQRKAELKAKIDAQEKGQGVADNVTDQVRGAGRSKAEATAAGQLHQEFFKTLAQQYPDKTPEELAKQFPFFAQKEGQQPAGLTFQQMLDQGTEHFQDNERFNKGVNGNIIDARDLFKLGQGKEFKDLPEPKPEASTVDKLAARYNKKTDKESITAIKKAQSKEKGPYVDDPAVAGLGYAPNLKAEPTGAIGPARISEPNNLGDWNLDKDKSGLRTKRKYKETDPLKWADVKFGATKKLIEKHKEQGIPLVINTSSDLVSHDDYTARMPEDTTVNMYLLAHDDQANRALFPGSPSRLRQEEAVKYLQEKGIKVNAIEPTAEDLLKAAGGKARIRRQLGLKPDEVMPYLEKITKRETSPNTEEISSVLPFKSRETATPAAEGPTGKVLDLQGNVVDSGTDQAARITQLKDEWESILARHNEDDEVNQTDHKRLNQITAELDSLGESPPVRARPDSEPAEIRSEIDRLEEEFQKSDFARGRQIINRIAELNGFLEKKGEGPILSGIANEKNLPTEPIESSPDQPKPQLDLKTIKELREIIDSKKPNIGLTEKEALELAKSSDPKEYFKAARALDELAGGYSLGHRESTLSPKGQKVLKELAVKIKEVMPTIRSTRSTTPDGNIWTVQMIDKDGRRLYGTGPTKDAAHENLFSGGTQVESMPAGQAVMGSPWQKAMLAVGANSKLRSIAPFHLLQQYELHLMFRPQSAEHWELGLAMMSRTKGEDRFVAIKDTDINRGLEKLIGAATIEAQKHSGEGVTASDEPSLPQSTATSEKRSAWTINAIYRMPKISLKDVLHLEPYPEKPPGEFFQDGEGPQGKISFPPSGESIVTFFKRADKSTIFHESGHYFLETLSRLAQEPGAPDAIVEQAKEVREWLGAKEGEAFTTEQHEKFAKTFEAYLQNGEAPSLILRRTFEKLRAWLTSIYRNIRGRLGVDLNPEVKGIFDRLLATEDAINEAKATAGMEVGPIEGLSPEVQKRVLELQDQAHAQAENTLMRRQMEELKAKNEPFLKAERERMTKEATAEISKLPTYAAMDEFRAAKLGNVEDKAALFLEDRVTDKIAAKFEALAEVHGFASGEELARRIVESTTQGGIDKEVRARVDAEMNRLHAPMMDSDQLRSEALKAIHDEKMTELLALEKQALQGLVKNAEIRTEASRRNRIEAKVEADIVSEHAKTILEAKPVKDGGQARRYVTAERNAAMKVAKAIAKKDFEGAAKAKQEQMLNHALAREAMRIGEEADKHVKYLQGNRADLTKMPYGFARQVRKMLSKFGLADMRPEDTTTLQQIAERMNEQGETASAIADSTGFAMGDDGKWAQESFQDFVKRVNEDYVGLSLPDTLLDGRDRSYRELNIGELRDLREAVQSVSQAGDKADRYLEAFGRADIKAEAARARESIESKIGTPYGGNRGVGSQFESKWREKWENTKHLGDAFIPEMVNVLTLCKYLDANDKVGPMIENVYRPIAEAESRKISRLDEAKVAVNAILEKHYTPKEIWEYKQRREAIPEMDGRAMTREQMLMMALNWGNEGNRERIRKGWERADGSMTPLSDEQIWSVMNRLDKKDWDFAQDIWNHLNTYFPDIAKLEMDVRGHEPRRVDPAEVKTKFGTYEGGYFPIAYDFEKSSKAYTNEAMKNELFKTAPAASTQTDRGHAIERVQNVRRPVRLSLGVLFNHLENVIHDLEYRRAVIDVARFLRQPDVQRSVENAIGQEGYRSMDKWLKSVASDQGEVLSPAEKALRWFRFGTTLSMIGFRPQIFLLKTGADSINAAREVGPVKTMSMIGSYALEGMGLRNAETTDFVTSKSERMLHRSTFRERDLMDMAKKWTGQSGWKQFAFWFEYAADKAVSFPLWKEVYQQNVGEFGDKKAIHMADEAVAFRLGSGSPLERVGAQRGGEFKKLTSMYYTFHSAMFNQAWLDGKMTGLEYRKENYGKAMAILAHATLYGWLLPALTENVVRETFRNSQSDDEEARKKRIISRTAALPFNNIWLARSIVPPLIDSAIGVRKGEGIHFSPAETALEDVLKPVGETANILFGEGGKEFNRKVVEDYARSASVLVGAPQTLNTLVFNYLDYLEQGEASWRDLVSRRVKK